ncbi:MAG: hypothetical protein AABW91_01705 [Nanoarchaeota archaeon]
MENKSDGFFSGLVLEYVKWANTTEKVKNAYLAPLTFLKPSTKILECFNKVIKYVYGKDISEMSLDEFRSASQLASLDGKLLLDNKQRLLVIMAANAAFLEEDIRKYTERNIKKSNRQIAENSMKWLRREYYTAEEYFYSN